jgi:hypothetical protein
MDDVGWCCINVGETRCDITLSNDTGELVCAVAVGVGVVEDDG